MGSQDNRLPIPFGGENLYKLRLFLDETNNNPRAWLLSVSFMYG